MRAVVAANVLVVGPLTSRTPPGQILDAWQAGAFELVLSEHILIEVERTHSTPYFRDRLGIDRIARYHALPRRRATVVAIDVEVVGVATHPEDDRVLATALSGRAEFLVTGDERFRRRVPAHETVRLVSPAEFMDILGGRRQGSGPGGT
jgi:uncharacterized protein